MNGFSTSHDETLAHRMSRQMSTRYANKIAEGIKLHQRNPLTDLCRECLKSFPCPTIDALCGEDT